METVIDLDIPPHESVLVLNGLLDTDTNARVVVSHSVGAFSNGVPSFIHNANVLLYKDDQFIDSLLPDMTNLVYVEYSDDNGNAGSLPMYYYKSDYIPEKDADYRVEVDHSNYNPISAETYIPDDIILYNIDVDTTSNEENIGFTFTFVTYAFCMILCFFTFLIVSACYPLTRVMFAFNWYARLI